VGLTTVGALRIVVTIDFLVVFLSTLEAFYFPFGLTFIISKFLTQRAGFGTYGLIEIILDNKYIKFI
jgi:hypothetical protein